MDKSSARESIKDNSELENKVSNEALSEAQMNPVEPVEKLQAFSKGIKSFVSFEEIMALKNEGRR
jgi:hypothetical protein